MILGEESRSGDNQSWHTDSGIQRFKDPTFVEVLIMVSHITYVSSSVGAVSTRVRLLCCVSSDVYTHIFSTCIPVVADPTLELSAAFLDVGSETFDRSQQQLTERALFRRAAAVSSSCISCW